MIGILGMIIFFYVLGFHSIELLVGGDWNMNFMTFNILGTIVPFDCRIFQMG